MRRVALVVAAVLVAMSAVPTSAGASAGAGACTPVDWGSGTKTVFNGSGGFVTDVRSGRHECFDRLVIDTSLVEGGYYVAYTDEVRFVGSGEPVPLRGGAKLFVSTYSPSYDENFDPTYQPANPAEVVDVTGYETFRQVAWAGSWEGTTDLGLGVRARLPFRVFTLPNHVVVDVAHRW
ncbi:AMIN-like domain-containing (lipo)protein [Saccharothrix deserti]|uniref:AMIN-like domain-containing (lipo)protein n=1 Tax=Saccharothrix deserti TaxID=2593674 RepID=UPI00131E8A6C|nr:hypothetical protein [Saccharothrix deserti]